MNADTRPNVRPQSGPYVAPSQMMTETAIA